MPFRGEIVGIEALAQTLFAKHPSGLDAQEAAIAAALVRSPNAKPADVAERACGVLKLQRLDCIGVIGLAEVGAGAARRHAARRAARAALRAPGRSTRPARRCRRARSTRRCSASPWRLRRQLAELAGRNVEDGAVVVLDNASGEVLAWVGSSGDLSGAAEVDGVLARRQPGSTLKPFVYELAFEKRLITPATLIDDSPAQIATGAGLYLPQNYDHAWKGFVSARTALGASLNVPAVRVGAMLGTDALLERLNALGLALPESAGWYGASLALGSADVSLLGLTNAYRALANGGRYAPVALAVGAAPGAVRVADAAAIFLVADILADNNARVRTFGWASPLATRGFAAVKTGTSKDMRDNWCVGFTDRYTIGVWVGNASGEAMHDVSGVSGAAPVWQAIAAYLHAGAPSQAPALPAGVVAQRVAFDSKREPTRDEVFLAGSERALQRATGRGRRRRALRHHQPARRQHLRDRSRHPAGGAAHHLRRRARRLAARRQARSASASGCAGRRGRAGIGSSCVAASGQTLQSVGFEVRGAGVRGAARRRARRPRSGAAREQPLHRGVDDQPAQAVEERADQRGDEAGDVEAGEQRRREIEHQRVDDEQEEAEREHRDRQRQQHQDRPQQRVEQAEHERRDHRRAEARDLHAGVELGHEQERGGEQEPANDDLHARRIAARRRARSARLTRGNDKSALSSEECLFFE